MLEGLPVFYEEVVPLHKSCVFDSLLQTSDHEFDVLTQQATELICSAMLLVLGNQCEDQLSGGKYWQPDENLTTQAASVPTSKLCLKETLQSLMCSSKRDQMPPLLHSLVGK